MEIFDRVCEIIKVQLNLDEDKVITEGTTLSGLNADSLDVVEIAMALEDEYEIEISDEDADDIRTVGDVVALVSKLI